MIMAEPQTTTAQTQAAPQAPAAAPTAKEKKVPVKRKVAAKKSKVVSARGKRKTAVARASARPGSGVIRVNSKNISLVHPLEIKEIMIDAMNVSGRARELAAKVDITVNVNGGGISAQAQAVRIAIAKCLVELDGSDVLKNELMTYDRSFLVEDPRRVEPKKFLGPKARARFQTSYR
jgi:small subunit ribosomal protein S9